MTVARRGAPGWVAAILAGLVLLVAPAAASQGSALRRHPTARELWRTYPLDAASPQPRSAPAPTPARTVVSSASSAARNAAARTPAAADGGSANSWLVPLLIVAAVALAAAVIARERLRAPAGAGSEAPAAMEPLPQNGRADESPAPPRPAGPVPPAPDVPWTAEIGWSHGAGSSTFRVVASAEEGDATALLAESSPIEWPPAGSAGVEAMTDAAQALEISLLAAGWRPLPPGDAGWYAKRFAWQPSSEAPKTSRRFRRSPGWADGAEDLWCCEIGRQAGPMSTRFRAVAYPPSGEAGRVVAESPPFRRRRPGEPDAPMDDQRSAVEGLAAALETAGWDRVAAGDGWYAERFVWRRPGVPPESVAPAQAERSA